MMSKRSLLLNADARFKRRERRFVAFFRLFCSCMRSFRACSLSLFSFAISTSKAVPLAHLPRLTFGGVSTPPSPGGFGSSFPLGPSVPSARSADMLKMQLCFFSSILGAVERVAVKPRLLARSAAPEATQEEAVKRLAPPTPWEPPAKV